MRDEPDLREMVVEYLVRHGFNVRTALEGEDVESGGARVGRDGGSIE
jgi:hypothetical protein